MCKYKYIHIIADYQSHSKVAHQPPAVSPKLKRLYSACIQVTSLHVYTNFHYSDNHTCHFILHADVTDELT